MPAAIDAVRLLEIIFSESFKNVLQGFAKQKNFPKKKISSNRVFASKKAAVEARSGRRWGAWGLGFRDVRAGGARVGRESAARCRSGEWWRW